MSHFSVVVAGDCPESIIEPFCYSSEGEWTEFEDETEYLREQYAEDKVPEYDSIITALPSDMYNDISKKLAGKKSGTPITILATVGLPLGLFAPRGTNVILIEENGTDYLSNYVPICITDATKTNEGTLVHAVSKRSPRKVPATHKYSFEEYVYKRHNKEYDTEFKGYGYRFNPQGMYDWCTIGGRYSGFFPLKEVINREEAYRKVQHKFSISRSMIENIVNSYGINDTNTTIIEKMCEYQHLDFYKILVRYTSLVYDDTRLHIDNQGCGVGTADACYIEDIDICRFNTRKYPPHAFLYDGSYNDMDMEGERGPQWHALFYKRFLADLDPQTLVTIVDCHT